MDIISDSTTIGMVFSGIVGYKVLTVLIDSLVKRIAKTDYVTVEQCNICNDKRIQTEKMIQHQLAELRGIILIIALKTGVKENEITKLVKD